MLDGEAEESQKSLMKLMKLMHLQGGTLASWRDEEVRMPAALEYQIFWQGVDRKRGSKSEAKRP